MHPVTAITAIMLTLGTIEGVAFWWMHSKPTGLGEPVLVYRPEVGEGAIVASGADGQRTAERRGQPVTAHSQSLPLPSTIQNPQSEIHNSYPSPSSTDNRQLTAENPSRSSTRTPLSEVVAAAIPSLRCTTGTAARIDREDDVTLHVAFFEWDLSTSANVLEAFKHLPEQCMGSIGLTLVEIRPPRTYKIGDETLSFDHTVFRHAIGKPVHAFKGVWVSGAANLLGDGLRGGIEQWRQIRMNAALKRFRPAHARVAQAAVHGIANPDRAWEIFEESMLRDLDFER